MKLANMDLILDQAGSHFSSLYFFFQSVHRVRKTVHSRCLNSTRHPHQTGTPRDGLQHCSVWAGGLCPRTELKQVRQKWKPIQTKATFSETTQACTAPEAPHLHPTRCPFSTSPGTEPETHSRQELHHRTTPLPRATFSCKLLWFSGTNFPSSLLDTARLAMQSD